jgi:Zn-dependent protease
MFIKLLTEDPNLYFMWITLVIFSVCCHEYMHARVALWQGDDTAALQGHLTLNPLRQMGTMALIMLLIMGITWGQVPVDPRRMRRRFSSMLVALSGPLTNLVLFCGFVLVATAAGVCHDSERVLEFFIRHGAQRESIGLVFEGMADFTQLGAVLNVVLFAFNLLPIPPLDGYTVFSYFLPGVFRLDSEFQRGLMFFLFVMVFFSFQWLWMAGSMVTGVAIGILHLGAEAILLGLRMLTGGGLG